MLSSGEIISAAINLGVAIYLIHYYPRSVRRQFRTQPMPPLFAVLVKAIPVAGYLLAGGTVLYVLLRLSGVIAP